MLVIQMSPKYIILKHNGLRLTLRHLDLAVDLAVLVNYVSRHLRIHLHCEELLDHDVRVPDGVLVIDGDFSWVSLKTMLKLIEVSRVLPMKSNPDMCCTKTHLETDALLEFLRKQEAAWNTEITTTLSDVSLSISRYQQIDYSYGCVIVDTSNSMVRVDTLTNLISPNQPSEWLDLNVVITEVRKHINVSPYHEQVHEELIELLTNIPTI